MKAHPALALLRTVRVRRRMLDIPTLSIRRAECRQRVDIGTPDRVLNVKFSPLAPREEADANDEQT
jgi:hypothetical protein